MAFEPKREVVKAIQLFYNSGGGLEYVCLNGARDAADDQNDWDVLKLSYGGGGGLSEVLERKGTVDDRASGW